MNNSSKASHRPDSLIGAIAAFEGIKEACTLLNVPIGCKVYAAYMAEILAPHARQLGFSQFTNFYFGQRRVPCTYIDQQDFVYGTEPKVIQALQLIDSKKPRLIGVINHSGTSLIGDDLNRFIQTSQIRTKTVTIDSSGFTGTYAYGFQTAVVKILEKISNKNTEKIPKSVNIIGFSIFHYNWGSDIAELKRMLTLLGVKVVSVICSGESIFNLEKASQAELNLLVYEEYGDKIVAFMEKEYGIPVVGLAIKTPYGFTASETWFNSVAEFFKTTNSPIKKESSRARAKCYPALLRASSLSNDLCGLPFGIFGDSSQVVAMSQFLYEYLGMYPVVIGLKEVGAASYESLKSYLTVNSLDTPVLFNPDQYELLNYLNRTKPALILGSSVERKISMLMDLHVEFIPFSFPYYEKYMLTNRPLIGFNGVLTIMEDILNTLTTLKLNNPQSGQDKKEKIA